MKLNLGLCPFYSPKNKMKLFFLTSRIPNYLKKPGKMFEDSIHDKGTSNLIIRLSEFNYK